MKLKHVDMLEPRDIRGQGNQFVYHLTQVVASFSDCLHVRRPHHVATQPGGPEMSVSA